MSINFEEIRHCIPNWIFSEYGQLTGNYVHYDRIVCVCEEGRIKIWLDQESYDKRNPEGLICDYDEGLIRGERTDERS